MRAPVLPGLFEREIERLEQGEATNRELAAIALKYTSRVSAIRQAGYDIRVVEQNARTGYVRYRLVKA